MKIIISSFLICMVAQELFGVMAGALAYMTMIAIVVGVNVFKYKQIKRTINNEK